MTVQSRTMLATKRLNFESWTPSDFVQLFDLHADLRVQMGYAPGPHKWTTEGIKQRLSDYMKEQAGHGFTKWKLCLADGTFIGRAGWSPWENETLEIGYAIKPEFWNLGYASEAALGLMSWARANHPQKKLVGFALPENIASRRIIEKLGMTFLDTRQIAGAEFAYYELNV